MARKIRFPLTMKDGTEARTLEELQEHFDLESVLGYFADGKLRTWLADRYYEDMVSQVDKLSIDMPDLGQRICALFGVEYSQSTQTADMECIQQRNDKVRIISGFTDNQDVIDNIQLVAMNQDELYNILDGSPDRIYLFGEKFVIPYNTNNIHFIGLNSPTIQLEDDKSASDYRTNDVIFENVLFLDLSSQYYTEGEQLFLEGKYNEALPVLKSDAEDGNPRAMCVLAFLYNDGFNTVKCSVKMRNELLTKAENYREPISLCWYAFWVLSGQEDKRQEVCSSIAGAVINMAEKGDILAQAALGKMCYWGSGIEQNKIQAAHWYGKAAEKGFPLSQCDLGRMYASGDEIEKDNTIAKEWYEKAANHGCASAQVLLGGKYYHGSGVSVDYNKALEYYKTATEQGYADAFYRIGWMYREGKGVSENLYTALDYYTKAANYGCAVANSCIWTLKNDIDRKETGMDYGDYLNLITKVVEWQACPIINPVEGIKAKNLLKKLGNRFGVNLSDYPIKW